MITKYAKGKIIGTQDPKGEKDDAVSKSDAEKSGATKPETGGTPSGK